MTGETSGTTVTFVVIDEWTVTVASVGDSRCILDSQGGVVSLLTVDHRLEENVEERERVTASGGEVGRLNVFGGNEVWCSFLYVTYDMFRYVFYAPLLPSCFFIF
jgi:serine/threonine protein phosphatase PrpC